MAYLFLCSIGPVQDFIATARKSRDLGYGSWMLSELSKAAAKEVMELQGTLIFPTSDADLQAGSATNVPNKIVATIAESSNTVGEHVNSAIQARLQALRINAFNKVGRGGANQFKQQVAEAQLEDLVELYWVSVEFDGSDSGYRRAREVAERVLNARKATRNFVQFKGDYVPKSSLDGMRESVIDESAYPRPNANSATKERMGKELFRHFKARPAERLSGVDILKRLGQYGHPALSFPSTSDMAARPFLLHVDNDERVGGSKELLDAITEMLGTEEVESDEMDGALVYSSRLAEWIPNRDRLKEIKRKLDEILYKYAGEKRPYPYFALLLADGDNMGATIDNQKTMERHQALSQALSQFAADVKGIVNDMHRGSLIYAGGDDVLAYLPLHTVLPCADELATKFAAQMNGFTTAGGKSPTLSAGIVVAHHLQPLSDTLESARQAEKAAKSVVGKHALAITVSKRSGVDRTIKGRREDMMKRLAMMICWRRAGDISAGTPYELQKLYQVLGGLTTLQDALLKEAMRIIERKRESGGAEMSEAKRNAIEKKFRQWLEVDEISLSELAHEMIIAKEFASAMDMAGVEKKECESS